jgi:hypothetical protein
MSLFRRNKVSEAKRPVIHEVGHGLLNKLREAVKGTVSNNRGLDNRLPHPAYMSRYATLCQDPTVSVAIDIKRDMVVPDFYYEMPEEEESEPKKQKVEAVVKDDNPQDTNLPFKSKVPKPEPKKADPNHPNKKKLEEWKKNTKATKKLKQIVGTMIGKGFCPVLIEDDYALKILPPENFYIYRDKYGKVLKYTQEDNMQVISTWEGKQMDDVILFINDEDTDHPYGEADVESLVTLLDTREQLNTDMGKIIHRFSAPFGILRTDGSAEQVKSNLLEKDIDEILFLGNTSKDQVELLFEEPDPQCKFLPYIDSVDFQIGQKLNAPLILLLKNATEASATKMLDAIDRWVQSTQNEIAEILEERIYKKIVVSGPVPVHKWGAPREVLDEITLADINNAVDKSMSKKQAQDLIRKKGIELIEDEEWLNKEPEPSPFGNPFDPKAQKSAPFGAKPKVEIPVEAIEKLNDLHMALDIIEENFKAKKKTLTETCRYAEQAIRVYMQRAYPEDWQERYESAFKQFISERLGGIASHNHKHAETYKVTVD